MFFGGPVQFDHGFVLHRPVGAWKSTLPVGEIGLTTSRDILEAMATGSGPREQLVALGYAGWAAGPARGRDPRNGWLTVQADLDLIFDVPPEARYDAAMQRPGREHRQPLRGGGTRVRAASAGHPQPAPVSGTLLGFDFGAKRIGVAVGETATRIAHPLGAIDGDGERGALRARSTRWCAEWQPAAFVVGPPAPRRRRASTRSRSSPEKFARRLAARYALPVALRRRDAHLGRGRVAAARAARTRAKRKGDVDALAAA